MARAKQTTNIWSRLSVLVLESRRVVGVGLLAVLGIVVLGSAAGSPRWLRPWLLASGLLAFAGSLIVTRFWAALGTDDATKPYLIDYQGVFFLGLVGILFQSRTPGFGLGVHRGVEAAAVFLALVAFCVLAGDPRRYDAGQWLVLGCFATVLAIYFFHSLWVPEASMDSRSPLWWGVSAGVCLAVLPAYVSREAFLWAVNRLAAGLVLVALPVYVIGTYSVVGVQVGMHGVSTIPILGVEVRSMRSVFATQTAFAVVVFAGVVAAVAELYRSFEPDQGLIAILMPSILLAMNGFGLVFSIGLTVWVVMPIALGISVADVVDERRVVPIVLLGGFAYLASGIGAANMGRIPSPVGTGIYYWHPTVEAILNQPTLLGQGFIAPVEFVAEHNPRGVAGEPRNGYLSTWIRTGIVGGIAYLGLVGLSVLRGLERYRDIDVAVYALVVGFAAHQLFEGYTLFQTGSSSVLAALAFGLLVFGGGAMHRSYDGHLPSKMDFE